MTDHSQFPHYEKMSQSPAVTMIQDDSTQFPHYKEMSRCPDAVRMTQNDFSQFPLYKKKMSQLQPADDSGKPYVNKVMIVSQPLDEKKAQEITKYLYSSSDVINIGTHPNENETGSNEVLKINRNLNENLSNPNSGSNVIVDTACPISMSGMKWFKKMFLSMPKAIRSQIMVTSSKEKFQFGGGERRDSLGQVIIPGFVLDEDHQAHRVAIRVELVNADIDMLLGLNSLDLAEATMTLGSSPYLTLPNILTPGTRIPLRKYGGHNVFTLFPPTSEDDKEAAQMLIDSEEWTPETAKVAISYIVKCKDPNYEAVLSSKVLLSKSFRKKEKLKDINNLTRENIIKLHHYFGHCTAERLEKLMKRAGKWRPEHAAILLEIKNCQICAVESKRNSLPKTAIPRASNFNQLVTMDIKYNTKFSNKMTPYTLYMIDAFTRFKVGVFIPNKAASTVLEAFLTNWVRTFGRPSGLHFD